MRLSKADRIKVKEISEKKGIPFETVKKIWESQFEFIKETLMNLDLPRDLTRKEFNETKTNFNIPCIGKLYANYYQYLNVNGRRDEYNKDE